jgi:hypothetical protein
MCVRCMQEKAPEPLGLCAACALHTRIELTSAVARLERYLAAWAAFDDWLAEREPPSG